jgi:hypothetical protein
MYFNELVVRVHLQKKWANHMISMSSVAFNMRPKIAINKYPLIKSQTVRLP